MSYWDNPVVFVQLSLYVWMLRILLYLSLLNTSVKLALFWIWGLFESQQLKFIKRGTFDIMVGASVCKNCHFLVSRGSSITARSKLPDMKRSLDWQSVEKSFMTDATGSANFTTVDFNVSNLI